MPFASSEVTLGNLLSIVAIVLAYLKYRSDQKQKNKLDLESRDKFLGEQVVMHAENQRRLDLLLDFQRSQEDVNKKRDDQIGELRIQTATIAQIANGIDRRLQMLEDRG